MTRVGLVCEAESDQRTACTLAVRILGKEFETCGINPAVDRRPHFSKWSELRHHEPNKGWPRKHIHGFRTVNEPVHGDTSAARKALWLFQAQGMDAVILMRDGDDQGNERYVALDRARREHSSPRVVLAVPKPEREAWHIAGFIPADADEHARLNALKRELPFDPCTQSHELKHGDDQAKRNAKRVLAVLTADDADRIQACISETALELLRERGSRNGLAEFMNEVTQRLGPILQAPPG